MLTLIADGRTNKEVGDELKLAEKTVKNYVSSILSKLEVARRAEAAAYLARHHDAGLDRVIGPLPIRTTKSSTRESTFDRTTIGHSADGDFPQMAYGRCMQAFEKQADRSGSTRVLCRACEHSEFVHGDHDDRRCLYSDCGCRGFATRSA